MKLLAVALLISACASPCYPKLQIYHEGTKPTGGYAGTYCPTKGYL